MYWLEFIEFWLVLVLVFLVCSLSFWRNLVFIGIIWFLFYFLICFCVRYNLLSCFVCIGVGVLIIILWLMLFLGKVMKFWIEFCLFIMVYRWLKLKVMLLWGGVLYLKAFIRKLNCVFVFLFVKLRSLKLCFCSFWLWIWIEFLLIFDLLMIRL